MKKLFFLLLILASLSSCKKEEEVNVYYLEFQLKDADGNNNLIKIIPEDPQTIYGNGIKGIDSVIIGFYIGGNNFISPSREEIKRSFATSISIKIPKEEFNINSRK
jgi:hypothetical protein